MKAGIIHPSEGDEQTASKIAGYRSDHDIYATRHSTHARLHKHDSLSEKCTD